MSFLRLTAVALAALLLPSAKLDAAQRVRVATYNIQFLKSTISDERAQRIRQVIAALDADVIGLQEIDDRAALERVFSPKEWQLVIDDDSGESQDVAVAVRRPFRVVGLNKDPDDLDADADDFLFPSPADDQAFPDRRDVLKVQVEVPNDGGTFWVLVHHAKARGANQQPARATTEPRRVLAAQKLLLALEQQFDGKEYFLVGDFNDNPDDRSLNVLESGSPTAVAGVEEIDGPFLLNVCEALVKKGHVSHGRSQDDIGPGGLIDTVDPLSRKRNMDLLGTEAHTGDILFDQILIPGYMKDRYKPDSAKVFNKGVAIQGPTSARASDHLPVYADFEFGGETESQPGKPAPKAAGLRIAALLPNPEGEDAGREWVGLANGSGEEASLEGWRLRDRAGNEFALKGAVPAGGELKVELPAGRLPLNNSGDDVALVDAQGSVRHRVSYNAEQARAGRVLKFE